MLIRFFPYRSGSRDSQPSNFDFLLLYFCGYTAKIGATGLEPATS